MELVEVAVALEQVTEERMEGTRTRQLSLELEPSDGSKLELPIEVLDESAALLVQLLSEVVSAEKHLEANHER